MRPLVIGTSEDRVEEVAKKLLENKERPLVMNVLPQKEIEKIAIEKLGKCNSLFIESSLKKFKGLLKEARHMGLSVSWF